jgi:hypothetical protein
MPKSWSSKDERQYEHIKDSAKERGRSTKRAKEIAAATVNKQRRKEGRTKSRCAVLGASEDAMARTKRSQAQSCMVRPLAAQ